MKIKFIIANANREYIKIPTVRNCDLIPNVSYNLCDMHPIMRTGNVGITKNKSEHQSK